MAKLFDRLAPEHIAFVVRQSVFFVASAAAEGRINLSPKDAASLRVLSPEAAVYLDQTGSGNETAAHTRADGRLTFMLCAFEGAPLILRLYGRGKVLPRGGAAYATILEEHFAGQETPGARQMVQLDIETVQTSCGYGVPLMTTTGERDNLKRWAAHAGEEGVRAYRAKNNLVSLDGLPTGLAEPD
jgi:hypothetical protein